MRQHQERRRTKRIKKHFIVTYCDRAHPEIKYDATQLKNVSLGGMCLITSKQFPPATQMLIDFKTPSQSDSLQTEGTVLESHEKIRGIIYETRMSFPGLSPQVEAILNKIIQHFDKEEGHHHE